MRACSKRLHPKLDIERDRIAVGLYCWQPTSAKVWYNTTSCFDIYYPGLAKYLATGLQVVLIEFKSLTVSNATREFPSCNHQNWAVAKT